jgi:hypothetical protein
VQFDLKVLSANAVPRALEKAVRYRLLNEPGEAESICLDVLQVDSDNQEAITTLVLALTDQFDDDHAAIERAWAMANRLGDDYERYYYTGLIHERRAKALLRKRAPLSGPRAYEWLCEAMTCYDRAGLIRPTNNDDAVLRWNACARLIMSDARLMPAVDEPSEPILLE